MSSRVIGIILGALGLSIALNVALAIAVIGLNNRKPDPVQFAYSMQPQFEQCMRGWRQTIRDWNASTDRLNEIPTRTAR